MVVVANSTNKTWISSKDVTDESSVQSSDLESNSGRISVRSQKLDDSEVIVTTPDIYEQSKLNT